LKKKLRRTVIKYFHASGPGIETLVDKMLAFEPNELNVTYKQLEILQFLVKGIIINEIAIRLEVSKSNIEKRFTVYAKKSMFRTKKS
jgi:DNA-binding NarL/FixJ family response regulator